MNFHTQASRRFLASMRQCLDLSAIYADALRLSVL
jgi:hypothetical protein